MLDYAVQRANMVDAQLATNGVADPRIRAAIAGVPRERFAPPGRAAAAYCDVPLEVAPGRFLLEPRCFAKLLMLADLQPDDHVLDVGCATGYSAAVLASLTKGVVAVEEDVSLARMASEALRSLTIVNAAVVQGTLKDGCRERAPYDVIVVEGAIEETPADLLSQLGEDGRLVAVVREGALSRAQIFMSDKGSFGSRIDFDATASVLPGFHRAVGFAF